MAPWHEACLLMKGMTTGPFLMGILSPKGECLLLHGALQCSNHLSLSEPVPRYLKHILPQVSESDKFWEHHLNSVHQESRIVQLEHTLKDTKLLVTLFPGNLEQDGLLSAVGLLAIEMRISADMKAAPRPASSRDRHIFRYLLRHP